MPVSSFALFYRDPNYGCALKVGCIFLFNNNNCIEWELILINKADKFVILVTIHILVVRIRARKLLSAIISLLSSKQCGVHPCLVVQQAAYTYSPTLLVHILQTTSGEWAEHHWLLRILYLSFALYLINLEHYPCWPRDLLGSPAALGPLDGGSPRTRQTNQRRRPSGYLRARGLTKIMYTLFESIHNTYY